uniref:Uncharacterized protein n=1 Tax=Solanum tuberosum TaxID=4113 RepID=M0ZK89_SOLTU
MENKRKVLMIYNKNKRKGGFLTAPSGGIGEKRKEEKEDEKFKIRQDRAILVVDFAKDSILQGLRILEQRAESVLSVNRQRFLAMLMLQLLRSFQPLCSFLRLSIHASTKTSNT